MSHAEFGVHNSGTGWLADAQRSGQKAMETLGKGRPQSPAPTSSVGFFSLPAELRDAIYVYLGLGTDIRPANAVKYRGWSDRYTGPDFAPKDLLNLAATCRKLCLEIRPLVFARSTLFLTSPQLRMFHTYSFRHQLLDFWPWAYVRRLVLHIVPDHSVDGSRELRTLGKLDLSKIDLVILFPYNFDILALPNPLRRAPNVQFKTCSRLNY